MNKRQLYITYRNPKNETIYEGFIHHIDACKSSTIIHTKQGSISESDIIRLPLQIKSIHAVDGKVTIYYFFDLSLEIDRR